MEGLGFEGEKMEVSVKDCWNRISMQSSNLNVPRRMLTSQNGLLSYPKRKSEDVTS